MVEVFQAMLQYSAPPLRHRRPPSCCDFGPMTWNILLFIQNYRSASQVPRPMLFSLPIQPIWCSACRMYINGPDAFCLHLRGRKHTNREFKIAISTRSLPGLPCLPLPAPPTPMNIDHTSSESQVLRPPPTRKWKRGVLRDPSDAADSDMPFQEKSKRKKPAPKAQSSEELHCDAPVVQLASEATAITSSCAKSHFHNFHALTY